MTSSTLRSRPVTFFWAILLFATIAALVLLSEILLPFAAGFVLAYLFHPFVGFMCRAGVNRGAAAFVIIAVVVMVIAVILALIVPPIVEQFRQLIEKAPGYYHDLRIFLIHQYNHYLKRFQMGESQAGAPVDMQQQIAQNVAPWLISKLEGLLQSSVALFSSAALLFLTPVVTFFLLRDWDKMIAGIDRLIPRRHEPAIRALAKEIDATISAYLRGALIVLIIVSAFYMAALGAVGLNYGLLIGLGAGLFSFVPYLGSTGGFLVSGGVALSQFAPDYAKVALVCGIFIFGQVVEGNVLTPNIVGNKVRLHPVWLLFALIASGYLFGFTGLLISVPLAAAIGVLVRYAVQRYYESPVYDQVAERVEANHPAKVPED